ncbi:MAG: dehydrogenase, partial [Candidatus Thermoplasmatota archaeon]|nr:dehydrogenase [Candidatus Thermoplasmatota archaeon]
SQVLMDLRKFRGEFALGYLEGGVRAGGFLYTNKDSLSIGVVIAMENLRANGSTYSYDIMEKFMEHPYVKPLVEGGRVQEYSAHLVPEGGIDSMPKLFGDGYLIAGDSASMTFSNGMIIQGMNYAIASGAMAADSLLEAAKKKDFSGAALSSYQDRLEHSQVLMDLRKFRGIDKVTWSRLVHEVAPGMMENILFSMFYEDGNPKKHLAEIILGSLSKANMKRSELIMETYRMLRRM